MNTNMTGFRWFSKIIESLCFGHSSFSIGRVKGDPILALCISIIVILVIVIAVIVILVIVVLYPS